MQMFFVLFLFPLSNQSHIFCSSLPWGKTGYNWDKPNHEAKFIMNFTLFMVHEPHSWWLYCHKFLQMFKTVCDTLWPFIDRSKSGFKGSLSPFKPLHAVPCKSHKSYWVMGSSGSLPLSCLGLSSVIPLKHRTAWNRWVTGSRLLLPIAHLVFWFSANPESDCGVCRTMNRYSSWFILWFNHEPHFSSLCQSLFLIYIFLIHTYLGGINWLC